MLIVPPSVKALIFDCDGTLADSMPYHMEAWFKAFEECGWDCPPEFFNNLNGMPEEDIAKLANSSYDMTLDPKMVIKIKHDLFLKNLHLIQPIEPVVQIVKTYFGKKPMAVVSGSTRENVLRMLKTIHVMDYFDLIFSADDDVKPKPAPDLFLKAAATMDVGPQYCQVFEDGEAGLEGARAAGMIVTDIRAFV